MYVGPTSLFGASWDRSSPSFKAHGISLATNGLDG